MDTAAEPYVVWLYFPDGQRTIIGFTDGASSSELFPGVYQVRVQIFGLSNTEAELTVKVDEQKPEYKIGGKITTGGQALIPGGFIVWGQSNA